MVRLRYRFPGPARIGDKTRLPSGRVYRLRMFGQREIEVEDEDAPVLLAFRGECCTGGKTPLFELA